MKLDIQKIQQRLFDRASSKIVRDYAIAPAPKTPSDLADAALSSLHQKPAPNPLEQLCDNKEVFRCAVAALGSNMRQWATFVKNEPALGEKLFNYDPHSVHRAVAAKELFASDIKVFLPGQSQRRDAESILAWARLLSDFENYYAQKLKPLARTLQECSKELKKHELLIVVAAQIGHEGHKEKLPGMGYALASEFLRNLGWNGFKPDRHIIRLFDHWKLTENISVQPELERLQRIVGIRSSELTRYFTYSLLGVAITPRTNTFSQTDNLVWMLGNYVEMKGKESNENYFATEPADEEINLLSMRRSASS